MDGIWDRYGRRLHSATSSDDSVRQRAKRPGDPVDPAQHSAAENPSSSDADSFPELSPTPDGADPHHEAARTEIRRRLANPDMARLAKGFAWVRPGADPPGAGRPVAEDADRANAEAGNADAGDLDAGDMNSGDQNPGDQGPGARPLPDIDVEGSRRRFR